MDLTFKTEDITWNIYICVKPTYHWLSFDQVRFNPGLSQAGSNLILCLHSMYMLPCSNTHLLQTLSYHKAARLLHSCDCALLLLGLPLPSFLSENSLTHSLSWRSYFISQWNLFKLPRTSWPSCLCREHKEHMTLNFCHGLAVILDKSLNLAKPQFPHLWSG